MSCHRTVLVEARFDGRLGKAEAASLERHLPTCDECASRLAELEALRADVRGLSGDVTPLAHQRARLALLRKAAEPTRAPRRRRAIWIGVALVFAPAAVFAARATMQATSSIEEPPAPATAPAPAPSAVVSVATRAAKDAPSELVPEILPIPTATSPRGPVEPRTVRTVSIPPSAPRPTSTAMPEPAASTRSPASRDFADAMESVSRGDFGAGAAKLERFAQQYPQDPRAEEAIYLEAIALERAGRADDARLVARRYLAGYPSGAHATQAHRLAE